jgi:hypothetical protein
VARKKGTKISRQQRELLSEIAKQRFRESLVDRIEPDRKRCSKCLAFKSVEEFWTRRSKLRSGVVVQRPMSWCKDCTREIQKARYEKTKEQRKQGMRLYHARTKDKKVHRQKRRETQALRRRKLGYEPSKWDAKQGPNGGPRLPVEPIARFIEERLEKETQKQLARITGIHPRRLYEMERRAVSGVSLATVDAILSGFDLPELLNELYPMPPEEGERVGYKIISI